MKFKIILILFIISVTISQSQVIDSAKIFRETFLTAVTKEDSLNSIADLVKNIDDLLKNKYIRKSDYSIAVYSLTQQKFFYKNNIFKSLTPASNTKLYTTFVALRQLSPSFFITTEIYTDSIVSDSIVNGNLYIVGRGDGMFTVNDLDYLVEQIYNLGIREVRGNIYADDSYFDDIWEREDYSNDEDKVVDLPPITSLSIEKNTATVLVKAGSVSGRYVNVQIVPNSESFGKWVTAKVRGGRGEIDKNNEYGINANNFRYGDELLAIASGRRSSVRVSSKESSKNGKQLFTVSGYLKANRTRSYRFHIIDPPLAVAGALKHRLQMSGIKVLGKIDRKSIDSVALEKRMFLSEYGRPIMEMINIINKESNNYLAENLFKIIGGSSGVKDSTAFATQEITKTMLYDLEIPFNNCLLNDGSGLSRRNLLNANSIINLLIRIYDLGLYPVYSETLSIAGIDGTLEKRMRYTQAQGNLRAKTGTLRNASALSGYVKTLDGELLAFSIIFNGRYVSTYKETENRIGTILSQFFYYNIAN